MNKLRYQKVNNHKVLHKVKKQWVVLGTTTLALFAMGVNAKAVHADSDDDQVSTTAEQLNNKNQPTADVKTASQSGDTITDNGSSVSKTNLTADDNQLAAGGATNVSLASSQPTNDGTLSASVYLSKTASGQASLGFSVTGSDSATYHQTVRVNNVNGYSSPYVIQYANDGSNSPITGIQNLVQHRQTSDGSVVSSSAAVADNVKFVNSLTSTPSTPILVSDANGSGSTASTASVLEIDQGPLNSGIDNSYYSGDKLWWTFDPINNPDFKGTARNLTYMVGVNTVSTTPVRITFKDNLGNTIAPDRWITADKIYPGNTFEIPLANPSGYQFDGGDSTQGNESVENNNGSAVIKGTFDNWSTATVNLQYQKNVVTTSSDTSSASSSSSSVASVAIPTTGSIRYYDVSDPNVKKQIFESTITGNQGDVWNYSAQSQVNQFLSQGYQLVSSQSSIPADNFKLGADNNYEIDFTHATKTYNANDTLPSELNKDELTETFTRVISLKNSNDQSVATPITQSVTFNRTATYDELTHTATFSNWTTTGDSQFDAVTLPTISGYTASENQIDAQAVSANDIYNPVYLTVVYNKTTNQQVDNSYKAYTYQDANLPSGLQTSDLVRTFFKTFKLTDANNNVIKQVTLPVNYYRTAVYENGQFKGYSLDNTQLVNANTQTDTSDNDAEWYADSTSVSASDLADRLGSDYSMDVSNGWNSIVLALINSKASEGAISFNSLGSGSSVSTTTSSSTSNASSASNSTATSSASSDTVTSSSTSTSSNSTTTTTSSSATTTSSSATTTSLSSSTTTSVSSTVSTSSATSTTITTTSVTSSSSSSSNASSSSANSTNDSLSASVTSSSTAVSSSVTNSTGTSSSNDTTETDSSAVDTTSDHAQSDSDVNGDSSSNNDNDQVSDVDTSTDANSSGDETSSVENGATTTSQSNSKTTGRQSRLPQTGEDNSMLAEIELGLLLISFAGIFGGFYRRKQS